MITYKKQGLNAPLTKQLEIMKVSEIIKEIEKHLGKKLDLNSKRDRARLFISINRIIQEKKDKLTEIEKIVGA